MSIAKNLLGGLNDFWTEGKTILTTETTEKKTMDFFNTKQMIHSTAVSPKESI
jgi:carbohydrate-binding DOMON domain-containing protein